MVGGEDLGTKLGIYELSTIAINWKSSMQILNVNTACSDIRLEILIRI